MGATGTLSLIQVLSLLGIGGIAASIVNAIINRKQLKASAAKTGIEGTNVFVDTGVDLVVAVRQELTYALADLRALRDERAKWESERRGWYVRADDHSEWDRRAMRENPELPTPPALFPPVSTETVAD